MYIKQDERNPYRDPTRLTDKRESVVSVSTKADKQTSQSDHGWHPFVPAALPSLCSIIATLLSSQSAKRKCDHAWHNRGDDLLPLLSMLFPAGYTLKDEPGREE